MVDVVEDVSGRFALKEGETGGERTIVVLDVVDPLKGRRGTDFVGPTVSCD